MILQFIYYAVVTVVYLPQSHYHLVSKEIILKYFNGNMIILRSSRLLQVNEIIAENYGPNFTKKNAIERKRYLAGRYWFDCYCQACINNWPLLHDMKCIHLQIRCSSKSCIGHINVYFNKDFDKLYSCKNCGSYQTFCRLYQNIMKKCILWYSYGITIMNKQYLYEAAQILCTALKIFHHIAKAPYRFTHLAEIGLQFCLMNQTKN